MAEAGSRDWFVSGENDYDWFMLKVDGIFYP